MKTIVLLFLVMITGIVSAQVDTSAASLNFSGYAEVYYAFDFNQPDDHNRPGFFYSHNRHNEFNLNLGFLKSSFSSDRVRANLAIAAGTYMNVNYSAEPGVLKNIYEANAGLKLSRNKNLWLDAGIFASHIGFESAISKDCWSLTRSILADNTPYYESGAKITYTSDNSKWLFSGLVLNGWQHIQRPDGNNTPAFGTQIVFTPSSKFALNYSTFIGNDKPDEFKLMRYYHNFYGIVHFSDKFHVTAGFDYGMEQKAKGSSDFNNILSPVLIVKLVLNDTWSITARGEYYSDENGVIIATGTENGFQTSAFSLNLDYKIRENALWRIEGRTLNSKDNIFNKDGEAVNTNTFVTTSMAVSF
ncbi:MAG TPA: porin [Saprospiraceae bacterium]|nr:porin [Saprospiraceae bacterium]